jgi:Fibronectin type III domain
MQQRRASKRPARLGVMTLAAFGLAACSGSGSPASDGTSAASGTLTVSWNAPAHNTDGTAAADLTGFTIHYGKEPKSYTGVIRVDDPKATRYVVTGLRPGTYYFAVSANNSSGQHSALSAEASGVVK